MRDHLVAHGFNIYESTTQIIPIRIGDEKKAMKASQLLLDKHNIFIPAARWPAVPHHEARLRTTVCTDHTTEQIDELIDALKSVRDEVGF